MKCFIKWLSRIKLTINQSMVHKMMPLGVTNWNPLKGTNVDSAKSNHPKPSMGCGTLEGRGQSLKSFFSRAGYTIFLF